MLSHERGNFVDEGVNEEVELFCSPYCVRSALNEFFDFCLLKDLSDRKSKER